MYAMSVNEITELASQYWHFNKYFISYTGTGVINLFALRDIAQAQKILNGSSAISSQG